ncbi:hypothetical protein V4V45_003798 [Vibrio mimicus]|jgi:hypothetical protein
MTYNRLKINRFIAIYNGTIKYNEKFHDGLNVIRGEHSVGKSTLLDLIFYCLGGELKSQEWKVPLDNYDKVVAEICIGDKHMTLSREISTTGKPNINVFDGKYEDSIINFEDWISLGPVRSKNKMSFSEFMFEALGWGQSTTSDKNNLTMHQILRLMYLSQSSDATKLFRKEIDSRYDSESTKQAIGEFLLGLDDLSVYEKRQQIYRLERNIDSLNADINAFIKILGINENLTLEQFDSQIKAKNDELKQCLVDKNNELKNNSKPSENLLSNKVLEISERIANTSERLKILSEKELYIRTELSDCSLFENSLLFRIKSLNESKDTFSALGEISFHYCPSCFSTIENKEKNNSCKCALCKNDIPEHSLEERYTETLSELKYQERQNQTTMEKLSKSLDIVTKDIDRYSKILRQYESELRSISSSTTEREVIIEKYSKLIHTLEKELEDLFTSKSKFEKLNQISNEKTIKEDELRKLTSEIKELENKSEERRSDVLNGISNVAKELLEKDSGNEYSFSNATSLDDEIKFNKDLWSLGGRVAFSDSSNVVKKSSFQLSMLLRSIHDELCRLPRFMIMDFECGDLNEGRSHNLQKNIMDYLTDKCDFQLIITSSKVLPELNNESYGVGRYYDKNDYIFKT